MGILIFLLQYFVLFLALSLLSDHVRRKILNHPPVPFSYLPFIGHLYLFNKPLHRALSQISARHGPLVLLRFGSRRVLLVSSPSAAQECFTKNDVVFANRPRFLAGKHLGYNFSTLSWSSYGDHWRTLRRISSLEILSAHRLQTLSGIRSDEVRSLIRRLFREGYTHSAANRSVDMKSAFFELMLNVLMRMMVGKRYCGESSVDMEEAKRFKQIVTETFQLMRASNVEDYLPATRWMGLGRTEKKMMELQKKRDKLVQDLIEEHRRMLESSNGEDYWNCEGGKKTMIEVLLTLQKKDPLYYTDYLIQGMLMAFLSAGTDTSAATMEWALSLLLNNPHVLKKAQVEIDEHVGFGRLIDESDVDKLPYLRCIIKETQRMYPATPLLPLHESSKECKVGDFHIPSGTILLVNLWGIQNNPEIWSEPTKFHPERFQGKEGDQDGFKLMPFGSGRRSCPGQGLAIRVVGFALASLLQCFEWERNGEEMIDMSEGPGMTMPKLNPLVAKYRPRKAMMNVLSQI
ncbi:cytochrome P450 81Q32-like [Malania oleifera]|uniref:cytochrome P450 81Q32-like n=1 Tax=Malania oleifera TaxID=397392 RepID=UPI0025AE60D6|nr:cytochrome P450 81Q32-like [Malania oleifera]